MDYTSVAAVQGYGDQLTDGDALLIGELISAYSAQIDRHCNQTLGEQEYVGQTLRAAIDVDGVLMCWPPVPTMSTPSAVAWRLGMAKTWSTLNPDDFDIEDAPHGCVCRMLGPNFGSYRGARVQLRLSYTGGWAAVDLPADLELAARRLTWWAYKLREAPINRTAIPDMGQIVIPPSGWPKDIKEALRPYVRQVMA